MTPPCIRSLKASFRPNKKKKKKRKETSFKKDCIAPSHLGVCLVFCLAALVKRAVLFCMFPTSPACFAPCRIMSIGDTTPSHRANTSQTTVFFFRLSIRWCFCFRIRLKRCLVFPVCDVENMFLKPSSVYYAECTSRRWPSYIGHTEPTSTCARPDQTRPGSSLHRSRLCNHTAAHASFRCARKIARTMFAELL